jgi:Na+/melibiose symporter-like transporter
LLSGIGSGPLHQAPFLLAAGFSFLALMLSICIEESASMQPASAPPKQALIPRIAGMLHSPLALYAVAFFCLNLSFAQVEASFVLLLRDYLGFGARQTGWLFTYIGVCIILVQAGLINIAVRRFGEVGTVGFGASLLVIGQLLTVVMALGLLIGNDYPLVQMVVATTAVCFGFGFSNPALSAAASNAAGAETMGGALGTVQGFGSLGQVGGLVLAGPLYHLGGAQYSFGFGAVITCILLAIAFYLRRQPVSA